MKLVPWAGFGLFLGVSAVCRAEIYNCNGKWTNQPCGASATPAFAEKPLSTRTSADLEFDKKAVLVHTLEQLRWKVKKEHFIYVDISDVKEICLEENTTQADCRSAVTARENQIQEKIRLALEIEAGKRKIEDEKKEEQKPPVVVVEKHEERIFLVDIDTPGPEMPPPGKPEKPGRPTRSPSNTLAERGRR